MTKIQGELIWKIKRGYSGVLGLLFITFLLVSCWETEKQSVVQETWEILNDYADTLEWTIYDAKAAKALIEANQQKLKDNLNVY